MIQLEFLTCTDRDVIFGRLRGHTASVDGLDPLLTKRGIDVCCKYGFDCSDPGDGRMALRCLCNALFQAEKTRQIFVDTGYAPMAVKRMSVCLSVASSEYMADVDIIDGKF